MLVKYPRTFHLPWSPGCSSDDKIQTDLTLISQVDLVVLEKRDGENTTMYHDGIHARSIDSNNHPSRNWVKGLWGNIRHEIPEGWRICGENLYAKHSIHYTYLESYFEVFSIWNGDLCLSWEETAAYASMLGLKTVPEIFKWNRLNANLNDFEIPFEIDTEKQEGYVVRPLSAFYGEQFNKLVLKWVRPNHVQTTEHWSTQPIIKNELKILQL